MQSTERDEDPFLGFRFRVEIDGLEIAAFTEVSGLQVEIEAHDLREGGVNEYVHKLAGPAKYPSNLVLKHGIMDADELWTWERDIVEGRVRRRNGAVVLMDSAGNSRWRWNFREAYPVRWHGPELKAGTAEVAVETLELVHRGITSQGV